MKFEISCKTGSQEEKAQMKDSYLQKQKHLKDLLEKHEMEQTEKRIQNLVEKTKIDPNMIWKARKKAKNDTELDYNTVNEEGQVLNDPEKAKEHIAQYFEDLYQARPGTPEYAESTEHIKQTMRLVESEYRDRPDKESDPITNKEIDQAIKRLKRNKSSGPDNIPNEIFIEADTKTRRIYKEILNKIHKKEEIPDSWLEGQIKRLYKGKGMKGKCSNERGITLASNIGKVYERIINERVKKQVTITDTQAGGTEGNATVDHLITLKQTIQEIRNRNKTAYIVFLDVQKAYDKAWLDAILYAMHKNGVKGKNLQIMKLLNSNLTARIRTKYGLTRKIKIRDSIRQGGVLSVIEYATLMDEISKKLKDEAAGIKTNSGELIGSLLWMDDVVLIHEDPDELQRMLDITNEVAMKYHIEFGAAKCKMIRIGPGRKAEIKLNGQTLEEVTSYKYLGEMINNKANLAAHLQTTKAKVRAVTQKILEETGNKEFRGIKMHAIWQLVETTIIPTLTYGAEGWEPSKKELERIQGIFNNVLKTIIKVPQGTPTVTLLAETGFLPIQLVINKKRIMQAHRILNKKKPGLIQRVTNGESIWKEGIRELQQTYKIDEEDLMGNKEALSKKIDQKNREKWMMIIEEEAREKSKVKHWFERTDMNKLKTRKEYLNKLTRNQCNIIIKARTRMLPLRTNQRGSNKDQKCRLCGEHEETQRHVIQDCKEIKQKIQVNFEYDDIFKETEIRKMREMAETIAKIVELVQS